MDTAAQEAGSSTQPSARDAEHTRRRILDAAAAVFADVGLAGARVDEIAAQAGLNKRMLYHYFGDKVGLYRAVLADRLEALNRLPGNRAGLVEELAAQMDGTQARLLLWNLLCPFLEDSALGVEPGDPGATAATAPDGAAQGRQDPSSRGLSFLLVALLVVSGAYRAARGNASDLAERWAGATERPALDPLRALLKFLEGPRVELQEPRGTPGPTARPGPSSGPPPKPRIRLKPAAPRSVPFD